MKYRACSPKPSDLVAACEPALLPKDWSWRGLSGGGNPRHEYTAAVPESPAMNADPYDVLGASPLDPPETIKAKYRSCILRYHPDRPSGDIEMYKMVVWAYNSIAGPQGAVPGMPRKSGHVRKQSAKYTRKDPSKKGRAARQTTRRRSRSRARPPVRCASCGGDGYLERKTGMLFRKTRRYACASCGGTGKVDNAAAAAGRGRGDGDGAQDGQRPPP